MSYLESIPVIAGADLSAAQYKAVAIGGTIAATGLVTMGLLQNKPISGQGATLGYMGRSRYVGAAGVNAGAALMITTSGFCITATSGSNVVGKALATISSGGIGEGIFNFAVSQTLA